MGRPRPHDSPDPACPPRTWVEAVAGAGSASSLRREQVQRGGELGPPPGPPAARWAPPLTSAGPLHHAALRGSLAHQPCLQVRAPLLRRTGISPMQGEGSLGPTPRKTGHEARKDMPPKRTASTSLGRPSSALPAPGTSGLRKESCPGRAGSEDEASQSHPLLAVR